MRAGPRPWKKAAGPSVRIMWRIVSITLSFFVTGGLADVDESPVVDGRLVRTVWRVCVCDRLSVSLLRNLDSIYVR